ncbi:hypothetical protein GCM10027430_30450 [Lysobacter tyrosinilyticus]
MALCTQLQSALDYKMNDLAVALRFESGTFRHRCNRCGYIRKQARATIQRTSLLHTLARSARANQHMTLRSQANKRASANDGFLGGTRRATYNKEVRNPCDGQAQDSKRL